MVAAGKGPGCEGAALSPVRRQGVGWNAFRVGEAQFPLQDLRQVAADDEPARHCPPQGIVYGGAGCRRGPGQWVAVVRIGIGPDGHGQAHEAVGTDAGGIQQSLVVRPG